jgi:hypothetical protein
MVVLLLLPACAHKAAPPNPDRFPPSLEDLTVVNKNRVDLTFDKPMNSSGLADSDFSIVSLTGDTLPLLSIAVSSDGTMYSLLTNQQDRVLYDLKGQVHDASGNPLRFTHRFKGSDRPDTILPTVTFSSPGLYASRIRSNVVVGFSFSKPIDTLSFHDFLVLPESLRTQFSRKWSTALTDVNFSLKDSLPPGIVVTFIIPPSFADFAGNRPLYGGFTVFTSDSAAPPHLVKGRLASGAHPPRNGYVILRQHDRPMLATLSRGDGSFSLRADSEPYEVVAAADTNYDGRVELVCIRDSAILPDSFVMQLLPDTMRPRLDSLFDK